MAPPGSVDLRDLARILVKTGALQFGAFTLASGRLSSYYIDLRLLPSHPGAFHRVMDIFSYLAEEKVGLNQLEAVAGVPTAGLIYATALAYRLEKPLLYVRREGKEHGGQRLVEGLVKPGSRVTLVDDLITTGQSLAYAAQAIRREGGTVEHALVLLDRLEGGREHLASLGIQMHSYASITEVADTLHSLGLIEEAQQQAIYQQVSSPKT